MLCYLIVNAHWQLIFPAFFTGVAHALLFPAVITGGSSVFPRRYRGLATSLVLAMSDGGLLVGGPLVGAILHYAGRAGMPAYPTMFVAIAVLLAMATWYYAVASRQDERLRGAFRAGAVTVHRRR
jgi:MFS family permease